MYMYVYVYLFPNFSLQLFIQLMIIFTTLSIFSQTFFFKFGLVRLICSKFKFTFLFSLCYPIFFLGERFFRIVIKK